MATLERDGKDFIIRASKNTAFSIGELLGWQLDSCRRDGMTVMEHEEIAALSKTLIKECWHG